MYPMIDVQEMGAVAKVAQAETARAPETHPARESAQMACGDGILLARSGQIYWFLQPRRVQG
ncbi:hypothetical protein AJ88_11605 [Mesorhizobium amorphae CCBAU 01583]|nr:hypothetical protein AJ88_11605 [Mesorhizobium amorphae CCBAU 01583]